MLHVNVFGSGQEVSGVRGLGITNPAGTWGKWDMCLCFGCGWVAWARVSCYESGFFELMAGPGNCILC